MTQQEFSQLRLKNYALLVQALGSTSNQRDINRITYKLSEARKGLHRDFPDTTTLNDNELAVWAVAHLDNEHAL